MTSTEPAPVTQGARIRLTQMGPDPCPIPSGEEGEVNFVTDLTKYDGTWQIGVKWDCGRSLALVYPIDSFEILGGVA